MNAYVSDLLCYALKRKQTRCGLRGNSHWYFGVDHGYPTRKEQRRFLPPYEGRRVSTLQIIYL
jgi:hypothetical protein